MVVERVLAVFGLERVYMHRSVRRLRRNELVQRVPGHTLDVVTMLCNLANESCWERR